MPEVNLGSSDQPPFFVVGPPRSGTTLMARVLGRHPDVFCVGESHYFADIWAEGRSAAKIEDQQELSTAVDRLLTLFARFHVPQTQALVDTAIEKEALADRTRALGGGYGGLYYAFMSMLAQSTGKARFLDNTPRHSFYLDAIWALFPEAKVVGCVRDPRDYLGSYKNLWKIGPPDEREQLRVSYHPLLASLTWQNSVSALLKHASDRSNADKLILTRYETFVQDPEGQVRRFCQFLGIGFDEDMLRVETHNSSFEQASTGIFATSVGRWRASLSAEEAWWAQTVNKKQMLALDYIPEKLRLPKKALLLSPFTIAWALFKRFRSYGHSRAALIGLAKRRLAVTLGR